MDRCARWPRAWALPGTCWWPRAAMMAPRSICAGSLEGRAHHPHGRSMTMQAPNQGHPPPMLTPDVSRRWQMLALVAVIGFLGWLLAPVLMPFAIAAMLAYLGDPLADRLQRVGMGRTMAVSIVFSVIVLVTIGALLLLVPLIQRQVGSVYDRVPGYVQGG